MKIKFTRLLMALATFCMLPFSFAQECKNLPTVTDLLRADQSDTAIVTEGNFEQIQVNRKARQIVLDNLVACEGVKFASDWHKASIIMINGREEIDLIKSIEYANRALTMDPDFKPAKKMIANAWDKLLVWRNLPQWYGTQKNGRDLQPIARCVISNSTRREYGIPDDVIAKQPESCRDVSGKSISENDSIYLGGKPAQPIAKK